MALKGMGCQSLAQTDVSTPDISVPSTKENWAILRQPALKLGCARNGVDFTKSK